MSLKASRKRRKKSSRISGRRGHQFEFHDERSLIRAVRAAACAAREVALGEEEDSAESGQESEAGPSMSRNNNRTNGSTNRNESTASLRFLLMIWAEIFHIHM